MIKSMTGFGLAQKENDNFLVKSEVKSLNSKFNDISVRGISKNFGDREIELRNELTTFLQRGKISLSLEIQEKGIEKAKSKINRVLFAQYYQDLKETAEMVGADANVFSLALNMPKAIDSVSDNEDDEESWKFVLNVIMDSIKSCDKHRIEEGRVLGESLQSYIHTIRQLLEKVLVLDASRIDKIKERIQKHLNETVGAENIDKSRFEQELIYYIEKLDITEEKVRLENHLNYFIEVMNEKESNGKKLGFIVQEIGREINTIGSKANDYEVQRLVVSMKDELEKIKEQSANIL